MNLLAFFFSRSMNEEGSSTHLSLLPDCGYLVTSDITLPLYLPDLHRLYPLELYSKASHSKLLVSYFGLINKKSYWWFEWEMSPVGTCN